MTANLAALHLPPWLLMWTLAGSVLFEENAMNILVPLIRTAGGVHLAIAAMNLFLPKKLAYRENLARVSAMVRQIFIVHSAYIVLVLVGMAGLCLGFAEDLARGDALGRALSGFMALFWLLRVVIQLFFYDRELQRQNRAVSVALTAAMAFLGTLFAAAATGVMG